MGLQLGAPSVPFHYDAEVVNHFPQTLSIGAAWQAHPRWRVFTQLDWINWQEAFDELQVRLTHGTSAAVNGAVGSDTLEDAVPLRWRDQIVYRTGCEVTLSDQWRLRFGYSYGRSPVPESTLTPLTAVITEHVISSGAQFETGRWKFELGHQWDLPVSRRVGNSALRSGEYSGSKVDVTLHWIGLSATLRL